MGTKVLGNGATAEEAARMGQLAASRSLPSYAGVTPANDFDPATGFYNLKGANLRKTHAGMIRAQQGGGKLNVLVIGDSGLIGFNGATTQEAIMPGRVLQDTLAAALGVKPAGGIVPWVLAQGVTSDKWISTGTVGLSTYPGLGFMNAGATLTWNSTNEGVALEYYYSNLSTNHTIQIDGGSAINITPTGAATYGKYTSGALAYGPHTLKINAATNYVFPYGAAITNPSGIAVHNFAVGGARAAGGTGFTNWTDTVTSPSIYGNRKLWFDSLGITPDLVICGLGGNDMFQGDLVATAIAGLQTIRGWYPTADFLMLGGSAISGSETAFNTYSMFKYALADTMNCSLLDMRTRMGDSAEAIANGLIGADNVHPNSAMNVALGRTIADGLLKVAGGPKNANDSLIPPLPIYVTLGGPATVRAGTTKIPVPSGNYTIEEVRATAATAPTGASIILDVNKNGTTIYSGGTGRPTIAAGASIGSDGTPSTPLVTGGDWLTVDIDQIGSTVAGDTIAVVIELRRVS